MDPTAVNPSPICTATSSAVVAWAGRRDSRIYSVHGRTGVSPVPLGRQPERADSKNPADHFLVMPADIARSNETSCLAGQAGRLPYFANRLAASVIKVR